jgi:rare lipoprotein A
MKFIFSLLPFTGVFFTAPTPAYAAQCGTASFYHDYYEGRTTASGTTFRQNSSQAAHPTARFGTKFRVVGPRGSTTITITDRGPFVGGRIVDLSRSSFSKVASLGQGVARVCMHRLN